MDSLHNLLRTAVDTSIETFLNELCREISIDGHRSQSIVVDNFIGGSLSKSLVADNAYRWIRFLMYSDRQWVSIDAFF